MGAENTKNGILFLFLFMLFYKQNTRRRVAISRLFCQPSGIYIGTFVFSAKNYEFSAEQLSLFF